MYYILLYIDSLIRKSTILFTFLVYIKGCTLVGFPNKMTDHKYPPKI